MALLCHILRRKSRKIAIMSHCTYERPNSRYHKVYIDYQEIAGFDVSNGVGIRFFAQKTDERIGWCRARYGIPEGQLPPDAWLWLDESVAAPAAMAYYACGVRGRTTLARTIRDRNPEHLPPSLIQLGYVKTRYIARRSRYATPARVFTELHHDHEGKAFILVEDDQGYYLDTEGELHCSVEEGYSEDVNGAIANIDGSTPPALPRYDPKQKMVSQPQEEAHRNNVSYANDTIKVDTATHATISGGNRQSVTRVEASTVEDAIDTVDSSTVTQKVRDSSDVRTAPWNAETILALLSRHLAVPSRPNESDKAAMERYLAQWYEPALWMCHATDGMEPRWAWGVIERRVAGMLRGPTWYAKHRSTQGPITARNVVGPADLAKPLSGVNWDTVVKELDKAQWYCDVMTPYDGPPLEYESGYREVTQATEKKPAEPSIIVEEPETAPRPDWMTKEEAIDLCYEIEDAYSPVLRVALKPLGDDRWYASIRWGSGEDDWLDFRVPDEWRLPSP